MSVQWTPAGCPDDVAELLGAWAVDACSEAEAEAVMDHISRCQVCAYEAVRLRRAARALTPVRSPLRSRVLARARGVRAPASPVPDYAEPYAAQVSALDALLAELGPESWRRVVIAEYGWTAQDLVAHLAASDGLLAGQLGAAPPGEGDVDARTAEMVARHRNETPEHTRAVWRDQAAAICARLLAAEDEGEGLADKIVKVHWPLPVREAILARAFETWIHTTDIAATVPCALPPPLPWHVNPMADLGVRSLAGALRFREGAPGDGSARVVLSGAGGGDWLVPLGGDGPVPAVTLELDVLEFCFLAGGRRDPGTVAAGLSGDEALGHRLLAAAPAFSGP